jgi:hypothetical protein
MTPRRELLALFKELNDNADGNYVVKGIPMKKFGIAHTIKNLRKAKRLGKV